jgi:hypothetical protein
MNEPERVSPGQLLAGLDFVPLPDGTKAAAAFLLIKLDADGPDGDDTEDWSVRVAGADYRNSEFLGALVSYVHALTASEARDWIDDDGSPTLGEPSA